MSNMAAWLAVIALATNYGSRAVIPVVAHAICKLTGRSPVTLVGMVASAFFAGDLIAQAAAKSLVRRIGGSRLLSVSMAGLGTSMMLVMFLLQGSLHVLLILQATFGFFCGLGYPASHALIAEAVPAAQRTIAVSLIQAAAPAGSMLSNLATPVLLDHFGAVPPFAVFATLSAAVVPLIQGCCVAAPSTKTLQPLQQSALVGDDSGEVRRWLGDRLVQAMFFGMHASGFAFTFLYTFLPTFFVEAYNVNVVDVGPLTSLAPLLNAGMCFASGVLADRLIGRHGWQTQRCRMLMQLLGTAVPAASLLVLSMTKNIGLATTFVAIWMASHGFQTVGLTALFHDVGNLRASELFAMGNFFSKLSSVFAGQAISAMARTWGWGVVLNVIAVHYVVSGAVLVSCMGRTEQTRRVITPEEGAIESRADESPKRQSAESLASTEEVMSHESTNNSENGDSGGEVSSAEQGSACTPEPTIRKRAPRHGSQ